MAVTRQALMDLLEPAAASLGFEISDLEVNLSRGGGLVRVYIDSPNGVTVDDCERVSRQVSSVLDVANPIGAEYSLEVSSPGMDRRLVKPGHFERFKGAEVDVKLRRLIDGRRRVRGTLLSRDDDVVQVRSDGADYRLPHAEIDVVRLVPDYKAPMKP